MSRNFKATEIDPAQESADFAQEVETEIVNEGDAMQEEASRLAKACPVLVKAPRPGSMEELPTPEQFSERRNASQAAGGTARVSHSKSAVLRIHNRARSKDVVHRTLEVVDAPESSIKRFPPGYTFTEFAGAGVFDLFAIPLESGRVYTVTVEEHPASQPQPRPNPYRPGTSL